ncbi:MAG: N5-(cytidine 5'-diphosphoramidyl)-L-glutamine hydrolase [Thiomicrorhabdus sp.]|nr:MAG: N5-(cytidine 5'-diphosphoramidyl)-L-glutamine hydrolase [Thiomicrorhabdus sp.]
MMRVGITQRRDSVSGRQEVRDALDVQLAQLLWSLGMIPIPLCSGIEQSSEYLQALNLDGYILSGGNDIGQIPARDNLEKSVLKLSIEQGVPVLGVCRGMQYINHYLGGSLIPVDQHVATHHKLYSECNLQLDGIQVNSYHNYGVVEATLGQGLKVIAKSKDGVVEVVKHNDYPWMGIMWHPERETDFSTNDMLILKAHFYGS